MLDARLATVICNFWLFEIRSDKPSNRGAYSALVPNNIIIIGPVNIDPDHADASEALSKGPTPI
jgi:hypothetical protein